MAVLYRYGTEVLDGKHRVSGQVGEAPVLDDVANLITGRICFEKGLDGRDGLELFGFVVGDKLGEFLFQQLVLGFEARDEAEDFFQNLAQGKASVHGGGLAQLGQSVVLLGLVEDLAVDVVDDLVPPALLHGRRDGFVVPHGIGESVEVHTVDLHPLMSDELYLHCGEDVAAQMFVGAGIDNRRLVASFFTRFFSQLRQFHYFVVVELGLEVLAVAEEIEELEGSLLRVGDIFLYLVVE